MILCDVGVLLRAMVRRAEHHEVCRRELDRLRSTPGDMAVSELVLAAVLRIGTNPRIFQPCPTVDEVFAFLDALRAPPEVREVVPGPRHWAIFQDLIRSTGIRGSDTTDAYLAALALAARGRSPRGRAHGSCACRSEARGRGDAKASTQLAYALSYALTLTPSSRPERPARAGPVGERAPLPARRFERAACL